MKPGSADRSALTKMILKLFDHWKLSFGEQTTVLGLRSVRTIKRYRNGRAIANRAEMLERTTHLLAIHAVLRILFSSDRELVYAWMTVCNKDFGGKRPIDMILEKGLDGLRAVRQYLEFERER